jgi:16S rRNA (guanine527-N7)-methyltransferase
VTPPAQTLAAGASDILGRSLSEAERDHFDKYLKLLLKWQRSQRLLGSTAPDWIVHNVFLDSLLFTRLLPSAAHSIVDIGSGAGVPGIPLKIVLAPVAVTLVEARQKRASFLSAVVRELPLRGCDVLNARVEAVARESAGRFDVAVARCAGEPEALLESAAGLVRRGGLVIASGPPRSRPLPLGDWREVRWAGGRRLFWTHQIT